MNSHSTRAQRLLCLLYLLAFYAGGAYAGPKEQPRGIAPWISVQLIEMEPIKPRADVEFLFNGGFVDPLSDCNDEQDGRRYCDKGCRDLGGLCDMGRAHLTPRTDAIVCECCNMSADGNNVRVLKLCPHEERPDDGIHNGLSDDPDPTLVDYDGNGELWQIGEDGDPIGRNAEVIIVDEEGRPILPPPLVNCIVSTPTSGQCDTCMSAWGNEEYGSGRGTWRYVNAMLVAYAPLCQNRPWDDPELPECCNCWVPGDLEDECQPVRPCCDVPVGP